MRKLLLIISFSFFLAGCNSLDIDTRSMVNEFEDYNMFSTDKEASLEKNDKATLPKTDFWPETPKNLMFEAKLEKVLPGNKVSLSNGYQYSLLGIDPTGERENERRVEFKVDEKRVAAFLNETLQDRKLYVETQGGIEVGIELSAYIWIGDSARLENVNALLLREGLVKAVRHPSLSTYDKTFKDLENDARAFNKGIWK